MSGDHPDRCVDCDGVVDGNGVIYADEERCQCERFSVTEKRMEQMIVSISEQVDKIKDLEAEIQRLRDIIWDDGQAEDSAGFCRICYYPLSSVFPHTEDCEWMAENLRRNVE